MKINHVPIRNREDCKDMIVVGIDAKGYLLLVPKKGEIPKDFLIHHHIFDNGRTKPVYWYPYQQPIGK